MMTEKEDLGLSLSLSFANSSRRDDDYCNRNHRSSLQLSPRPSLAYSAPASHFASLRKASGNECFPFSDPNFETCGAGDSRSFLRGIDVNRRPAKDEEEEPGVSSPNSTISCGSGKKSEREHIGGYDHEIERASSRGISDEEDGDTSRKKLRLSKDQSAVLEESFKEHTTLNPKQKLALAKRLGLRSRQVEVWFQNRRARTKLKQTEVDCEILKRCCDQLTEENRRLQKEVQELRALKLSPQFYMPMTPPTTLTMCPSCERVAATTSFPSAHPTGSRPTAPAHHRPVPVSPWVAAPVPIPPFEALPPRA